MFIFYTKKGCSLVITKNDICSQTNGDVELYCMSVLY